jgi:hypothetical protein
MLCRLEPHPYTPCLALCSIEVEVTRARSGQVRLVYRATGDVTGLRLPQLVEVERANDLWRNTCFEAFIKTPGGPAYAEFNFSPSSRWAAYGFDDTRQGMRNLDLAAPTIRLQVNTEDLVLSVALNPGHKGPLKLAVCAVIEEVGGELSYWALTHPGERPDFHHPDGFVLDLPEPHQT